MHYFNNYNERYRIIIVGHVVRANIEGSAAPAAPRIDVFKAKMSAVAWSNGNL